MRELRTNEHPSYEPNGTYLSPELGERECENCPDLDGDRGDPASSRAPGLSGRKRSTGKRGDPPGQREMIGVTWLAITLSQITSLKLRSRV